MSLPCETNSASTVESVFGDDGLGRYGKDWGISASPRGTNGYRRIEYHHELEQGAGYWIKVIGADRALAVDGWSTPTTKPFRVDLVPGPGRGRWNLVGHPFAFPVSWSEIQVVDDATGRSMPLSDPASASYITSRTMFLWNGSGYQSHHPVVSPKAIDAFDGFWVRVKRTSHLEIPTEPSQPSASREPVRGEWWIELAVRSGTLSDPSNRFGRMRACLDGPDEFDLEESEPFGSPFLTVIFPHSEWQEDVWSYTTDLRGIDDGQSGEWAFEVRSDVSREITLTWVAGGHQSILGRAMLEDLESGRRIGASDVDSYTVTMRGEVHRFKWHVQPSDQAH